jgi:hypothetical protein
MHSLADISKALGWPVAFLVQGGLLNMATENSSTWKVEYDLAHAVSAQQWNGLLEDAGAVLFKTYNSGYSKVHGAAFGNWLHLSYEDGAGVSLELNQRENMLLVQYADVLLRVSRKQAPELTACGLRLAVTLADLVQVSEALGQSAQERGGGLIISSGEQQVIAFPFDSFVYLI